MNMLTILLGLIPLLPLVAALWIALGFIFSFNRGESGEKQNILGSCWGNKRVIFADLSA